MQQDAGYVVETTYSGAPWQSGFFFMDQRGGVQVAMRVFDTTSDPATVRSAVQYDIDERENDLAQVVHIDADAGDTHWTAEQCLRAGCCGAVLNWLPRADYRQLRRLQLAAETGGAIGFVFRPLAAAAEASPAALRLRITMAADGAPRIDILKCRGRLGDRAQAMRLRA